MNCDQCNAMMINGIFCHESLCPNEDKIYVDGEWQAKVKLDPIEHYNTEDEYEELITEIYGTVTIGNLTFDSGKILRELDETSFNCGISDDMKWECPVCGDVHDDYDDARDCCQDW